MKTTKPLSLQTFPRAIIHVDGDSFFASCEQALDPSLRGKPIVTGLERGIASAASYEAKACGVTRGMPLHEIRRVCPEAIIVASHYEAYSLFAKRMYQIVRRYTPQVEAYSIDECFADITGLCRILNKSYQEIAEHIKHDLENELGISFSVGLAPNKVLAKIASNYDKPSGLVVIPACDAHTFLAHTPVEKIWGIGKQTSSLLHKYNIVTAYDYATQNEKWVAMVMNKPYQEIYRELRGEYVLPLNTEMKQHYQSIMKGRTFVPSSTDREYIFSHLSKNIENACIKARRHNLRSNTIEIILKTHDFNHHTITFKLPYKINTPIIIINKAYELFDTVFQRGVPYRATRVILKDLCCEPEPPNLFGDDVAITRFEPLFDIVDMISKKYGKHTLYVGSSYYTHMNLLPDTRNIKPVRRTQGPLPGEHRHKYLSLPHLGDVI